MFFRLCFVALSLLLSTSPPSAQGEIERQLEALLEPHGLGRFPPLYQRAIVSMLQVEDALAKGDVKAARATLDAIWAKTPPGSGRWQLADRRLGGLHFGRPPAYYGLRMLTDVTDYRESRSKAARGDVRDAQPVRLAVVFVGRSRGVQPRTLEELKAGEGETVTNELAPELQESADEVVQQTLRVFGWYIEAISGGRLRLEAALVHLEDVEIPVRCTERHAGPASMAPVWKALPDELCARTDWWWILHPSHVPEQYPDFAKHEFITGGMGTGPDGASPCFLSDDRWLVRKPPHLGKGKWSELERRVYLPQWLQHEFFHHLYRTWPEFELEKKSHQWFDRRAWPEDFEGRYEPDYYHQSLHKRILPKGQPPLHVALRYRRADARLLRRIRPKQLIGRYVREPVENEWHEGEIRATNERGVFRWSNAAGRSWTLRLDLKRGELRTGPDCPYCARRDDFGPPFTLELARDPKTGAHLPRVVAFRFQGGRYGRQE